ncbi:hypothetical protein, partial [Pseudomonas syringae]|uniref:hypothetical protein n=1 Tax=Pseudomonas syringae TaxID=317 RepID=UPI001F49B844
MSAHGLYQLQANQYIQTATCQMHMRWQVIFFPQPNPVFIPESIFSRHEAHGIAKLAIPEAALQFLPGHSVTHHSRTEQVEGVKPNKHRGYDGFWGGRPHSAPAPVSHSEQLEIPSFDL